MKRFIISAGLAGALMLSCAGQAQARIFEPQHHWWSSGRTCVESRNPPGLAWDDLPPRACIERDEIVARKQPESLDLAAEKAVIWTRVFGVDGVSDKRSAKPESELEVLA